jgi:hypothetical protein
MRIIIEEKIRAAADVKATFRIDSPACSEASDPRPAWDNNVKATWRGSDLFRSGTESDVSIGSTSNGSRYDRFLGRYPATDA